MGVRFPVGQRRVGPAGHGGDTSPLPDGAEHARQQRGLWAVATRLSTYG